MAHDKSAHGFDIRDIPVVANRSSDLAFRETVTAASVFGSLAAAVATAETVAGRFGLGWIEAALCMWIALAPVLPILIAAKRACDRRTARKLRAATLSALADHDLADFEAVGVFGKDTGVVFLPMRASVVTVNGPLFRVWRANRVALTMNDSMSSKSPVFFPMDDRDRVVQNEVLRIPGRKEADKLVERFRRYRGSTRPAATPCIEGRIEAA